MPLDRAKNSRANAEPGGSKMPAMDYSKSRARGDGRGRAIPGGGTGANSAYKFKTADGYKTTKEINEAGLTYGAMRPTYQEGGSELPASGTSIFDPVLCELAYRWFCPPHGRVLDPFAGGSVRGIVAGKLGRSYLGVDLRAEQVAANDAQVDAILSTDDGDVEYIVGDSVTEIAGIHGDPFDFLFSCPPYGDLERYSDDPQDLSTMDHAAFMAAYFEIIAQAALKLKEDRFACFVVGDFRDKSSGAYRNFPGDTIDAFTRAGLDLYNEAILVTAAGSLPVRAGKQFQATRKLGKTHQNVLVFCKGDPIKATKAVGKVDFGEIEPEPEEGAQHPVGADQWGDKL